MKEPPKEVSLDPADWSAMRALAHRAVDDAIDYLATVRDRPVWQPTPDSVIAKLHAPLPREPQGAEQAYADFREWVMPYPMGNTHPRFWSWYMGGGTAFGAIADFLASTRQPEHGRRQPRRQLRRRPGRRLVQGHRRVCRATRAACS